MLWYRVSPAKQTLYLLIRRFLLPFVHATRLPYAKRRFRMTRLLLNRYSVAMLPYDRFFPTKQTLYRTVRHFFVVLTH